MKLVIFDLDGTLLNTLADLADAGNYALRQFNYPEHPAASYRYFAGNGIPKLVERILPECERTPERIYETKEFFVDYYNNHFADKTRPYNGITDLIGNLKSSGVKIAVASNKSDDFTQPLVKGFFGDSFDYIQGGIAGVPKKPAPDIVYGIMEKLGASPENTYFVGDSDVDILTAKNAGVTSIGCLWGFRTKEELVSCGAVYLAEMPQDIYKIVNNIEKELGI